MPVAMWLFRRMAGVALCGLCCGAAPAQHFSIAQWTHKDGLPSATIYAVKQTADGFLWLGTADGLLRYDGFQFERQSLSANGLRSLGQVRALLVSADGALIAGTAAGSVVRLKGDAAVSRFVGGSVMSLRSGPEQTIEVATTRGRVSLVEATLLPAGAASGSAGSQLRAGQDEGPYRGSGEGCVSPSRIGEVTRAAHVRSAVRKVLCTSDGALWIATAREGVFLARPGAAVQHVSRANGLSSDRVFDVLEDREKNVWVATEDGLNRLRPDRFVTLTQRDGLRGDTPADLAAGVDGRLWIGSSSGLEHFDGGHSFLRLSKTHVRALTAYEGGSALVLAGSEVYRATLAGMERFAAGRTVAGSDLIAASRGGAYLYGAETGLHLLRKGARPERIVLPAFAPATVTSMVAGPAADVWLGLSDGDVMVVGRGGSRRLSTKDGFSGTPVSFVAPQPDGRAWIATSNGLSFFDGRSLRHWDSASGLPGDRLLWAVPDRLGHLWIGYAFGVAEVSIKDLEGAGAGAGGALPYQVYDDGDGLQGNPSAHGGAPVAMTTDGKLCFTMAHGLATIDPAHIQRNPLPPPTHILQVTVDGKEVKVASRVSVSPLNRTLQMYYAGLSLSEPRKVRYRYRLDGFDAAWQEAGSRHNAFYTNLPPGSYGFHVIASNNDGVWNETGARMAIEIPPMFYQTAWFKALCAIGVLGFVLLLYRLRVQQNATALQQAYEARMAERSRIAQELHDSLIQEMMGVGLQLEIADSVTAEEARAKRPLGRALTLVQHAIGEGRLALQQLRLEPLTFRNLQETLRDTAEVSEGRGKAELSCRWSGAERPMQPKPGEEALQILREAVRNATLHGHGTPVMFHADYGADELTLTVRDRGPGIPEAVLLEGKPGHYGIVGMRERATRMGARLDLHTSPESGTAWELHIPGHLAYQPESFAVRALLSKKGAR